MKIFYSLQNKINNWIENNTTKFFNLEGVNCSQAALIIAEMEDSAVFKHDQFQIILCSTSEKAENVYQILKRNIKNHKAYLYPGLESSPYSAIIPSERNLFERFRICCELAERQKGIIVTTVEALFLRGPKKEFFLEKKTKIEPSDIISPEDLSRQLVELGYNRTVTVEERGAFSSKGEIFDIFPIIGPPVRLHYFDDMVEEIFQIDLETNRTIRDESIKKITIHPSPHIVMNNPYRTNLRENIPTPGPKYKHKFEKRKEIFSRLQNNSLFEEYPAFFPLFFEERNNLLELTSSINSVFLHLIDSENLAEQSEELKVELEQDYLEIFESEHEDSVLPRFEKLYSFIDFSELSSHHIKYDEFAVHQSLTQELDSKINLKLIPAKTYLSNHINPATDKFEYLKSLFLFLKDKFQEKGKVVFSSKNETSKNEINFLLEENNVTSVLRDRLEFTDEYVDEGFFNEADNVLVISEGDIFSKKKRSGKVKIKRNYDVYADQLSTLKKDDYVIHSTHGIGRYLGLESITHNDISSDFLVIQYDERDKVYVPVYRLDLVQKHASAEAQIKVANLRSNKFSALKKKARESAKKLAFDLLKLQASRNTSQAFAFSAPDHYYKEFELAFPYNDTPDQFNATQMILEEMQKLKPMDHLLCGDVGFGKTEVAMRASFKAVLDKKQVAVLVPTTILALQHYHSFKKRFSKFPVNINFLSRLKKAKETREIKEQVSKGEIDILIGTHKLLADDIKYKDLGLVIVDEEQRFGVNHKEKLKVLKSSVDFLTLTATPIPRTLQLAFLGLRDLSLIKTPPPNRQSIKTYLIKEDPSTLKVAIEKEINRGGQVFIVHNKVHDIELFTSKIRELVPKAKIVFAHGQLPEKELENRMNQFYRGEYQILIATTIIESGIDIPNANTLIVDRADTFGLSQLHQLRGRIGRSEKKAYAYFIVPNLKNISLEAEKRLKALQNFSDLGSGFSIANSDLEIRGSGNILGADQSGHIENIGLELYTEMLKEAIMEIKGEHNISSKNIDISLPFPAYLPSNYIDDNSTRLKEYKRLANLKSEEEIEEISDELIDSFGTPPKEFLNLINTLKSKTYFSKIAVSKVNVIGTALVIEFEKETLAENDQLRDKVIEVFMSKPKKYKMYPDYKIQVNLDHSVDGESLLNFSKDIASQILPC